jgi:hypothetical protein
MGGFSTGFGAAASAAHGAHATMAPMSVLGPLVPGAIASSSTPGQELVHHLQVATAAVDGARFRLAGADPVEWVSTAAQEYLGRVEHLRTKLAVCEQYVQEISTRLIQYCQAIDANRVASAGME